MSDGQEYTMHCINCLSTDNLRMMAHRKQGKMIGWIFVCRSCEPKLRGAELSIGIIEEVNLMQDDESLE